MSAVALDEYASGVENGKVVRPAELDEASAILAEARKGAAGLTAPTREFALAALDSVIADVRRHRPAGELHARVARLRHDLEQTLSAALDLMPAAAPSLARGARVYQLRCKECHGLEGRGDGPKAAKLDPKPANFTLADSLRGTSPLTFFRKISVGVSGTEMREWESLLSLDDRWAVALYVTSLRHTDSERTRGRRIVEARCEGGCMVTLGDLSATAGLSDDSLAARLVSGMGVRSDSGEPALAFARIAAAAEVWGGDPAVNLEIKLGKAYAGAAAAVALAESGQRDRAQSVAFDAYLAFEPLETPLGARDAGAVTRVEQAFRDLRAALSSGDSTRIHAAHRAFDGSLAAARMALTAQASTSMLFSQSLIIMLREGFEAILLVGALMAFAVKAGAPERKKEMLWGVLAAVGASLATAAVLATLFRESATHRETLEGIVMIVAAGVLFSVSYWLISKIEAKKWQVFVGGKIKQALTSGGSLALAAVAFLAVYREGFETVLFYASLFTTGKGPGSAAAITAGMVLGFGVLCVVYVAIQRWGLRLPLKPFFGVTSALLYLMAFSFAGQGIADLQEAGLVPVTHLGWVPSLPALGVFPTTETLAIQSILVLAVVAALVWVFWLEPRTAHGARRTGGG